VFERFSAPARRLMLRAHEVAAAAGHDWLGTEHLAVALVREETGAAAAALRSVGVSAERLVRDFQDALGAGQTPSNPAVDPEPLQAIGIDLAEVKRRIEESFGPGALEFTRAWRPRNCGWPTSLAKKVLEKALREALRTGSELIGPEHILMGLCQVPDALGADLLGRQVNLSRLCLAVVHYLRRSA
jgi:ATP-dependent Clp protease ATP-binding subunit ClpA